MSRASPLASKLITAGLKQDRPTRTYAELIAEHRELVAFAASVRDAAVGRADPAFKLEAALLVARCSASRTKEHTG